MFGGLPVVYYDREAGTDSQQDGILIYVDGSYKLIGDIKFYDPIHGFIQTGTHFYAPNAKKGKFN
jgi:hypothetical protein